MSTIGKSKISIKIKGKQTPRGTVKISGAKNAATRLMAAAMLTPEKVTLYNFPTQLIDAKYKSDFMEKIGVKINYNEDKESIEILSNEISNQILNSYAYPIRTTYLLAAGQLNRNNIARIPYPGGCKIGNRKHDLHIMVWEKMGCEVEEKENFIEIKGKLKPAEIEFPISTIGGTENALICASGINGTTIIRNAYISPEVYCLIEFLRRIGADIETTGNSFIRINGTTNLRGTTFRVIPDRIEAITWIIYGALSNGSIIIENVPFEYMDAPFLHLNEAGVDVFKNSNNVFITEKCVTNGAIQPFEMACGTYPGVISDMQPFFTLLGLKAKGISRVYDYRYPERTAYLSELSKFCPDSLQWQRGQIIIKGPGKFQSASVSSTDLRGSMGLLLAALLSKGFSSINDIDMALRGYNKLLEKFDNLGIKYEVIA